MALKKAKLKAKTTNDRVEIILFADSSCKSEVGELIINVNCIKNKLYGQVERFCVAPKYRNHGNGKNMLNLAIAELKKLKVAYVMVAPNPEPYEEEEPLSYPILYSIYGKLGFVFLNDNVNLQNPNEEMKLEI